MKFGLVVGTVVCSHKDKNVPPQKLVLVQPLSVGMKASGGELIVHDVVGAGEGEVVMFTSGSAARETEFTQNKPVDGVIISIVDLVEYQGEAVFDKSKNEVTAVSAG